MKSYINRTSYEQSDQYRRLLGKLFDLMGLCPIESPFRVIFTKPCITLRNYGSDDSTRPVLLIVPAPIKRAYIWDIVPFASVVQKCISKGLRVYMICWEEPGKREKDFGLSEYADRLIVECMEAIYSEAGHNSAFIAGHSLGGTLSAIFTSLHPERVKGLILLGSPLHFGHDVGAFGKIITPTTSVQSITAESEKVSGSFLNGVSLMASPITFGLSRLLDWLNSFPDYRAIMTHLLVERWTLDEMPFTKHLFEDIVEFLYRDDRFMKGTLKVSGRHAVPESVKASLFSVVDKGCDIVPPQAVLPFLSAVKSVDKKIRWYQGDKGVSLQHVGMLVGKNAHQHIWPEVIRWIDEHNSRSFH